MQIILPNLFPVAINNGETFRTPYFVASKRSSLRTQAKDVNLTFTYLQVALGDQKQHQGALSRLNLSPQQIVQQAFFIRRAGSMQVRIRV